LCSVIQTSSKVLTKAGFGGSCSNPLWVTTHQWDQGRARNLRAGNYFLREHSKLLGSLLWRVVPRITSWSFFRAKKVPLVILAACCSSSGAFGAEGPFFPWGRIWSSTGPPFDFPLGYWGSFVGREFSYSLFLGKGLPHLFIWALWRTSCVGPGSRKKLWGGGPLFPSPVWLSHVDV